MMPMSAPQHSLWFKILFFVVASGLAFFFGLISITANPILIGLALGGVLGVFFLLQPKTSIWLVLVLGLAVPALLDMLGHGLSRVSWGVSMLALLLWVPALFYLIRPQPSLSKPIPLFVWIMLFFVFYAVINSFLQWHGLKEVVGGFKRFFQTYGLAIALCSMPWLLTQFDQWLKALFGIALLQLPFALFERFILVPLRGGLAAGGEATDIVAGTMGANLEGGSPNSVMVTLLLLALGFIYMRHKFDVLDKKTLLWGGFILLFPLLLGETKVVVVMLPMMALVLLRHDILRSPAKYIPVLIGVAFLTFVLASVYIYLIMESDFVEIWQTTIKYNLQEEGYGRLLLNRTTSILFWWKLHGYHDPISLFFGHGLGSSYGAGLEAGHVAMHYPMYGINLSTFSTLLWDLGLFGLMLYLSLFVVAWIELNVLIKQSLLPRVKADAYALQLVLAFTLFFAWYSDSQVNLLVHEIILAFAFGYAGFLCANHRNSMATNAGHA